MTQKTLSLPEELYDRLKAKKGKKETFPDLIRRLISEEEKHKTSHQIEDLKGAFGDNSEEWEDIEKMIYEERLEKKKRKDTLFGE